MKRMYDQYIKKAKSDFLSIKNNLASEEIPADTCCFHAQQAAEKYLVSARKVGSSMGARVWWIKCE